MSKTLATHYITVVFLLLLLPNQFYSQAVNMSWADLLPGDIGTADYDNTSAIDSDGNMYIIGRYRGVRDFNPSSTFVNNLISINGTTDVYLLKLDKYGNYAWARSIGNTGGAETGVSVAVDENNNVYVTGEFEVDINIAGTQLSATGFENIYLAKFNSSGSVMWATRIGGGWRWFSCFIEMQRRSIICDRYNSGIRIFRNLKC